MILNIGNVSVVLKKGLLYFEFKFESERTPLRILVGFLTPQNTTQPQVHSS
jgi:hypothetical protein